MSVLLRGVRLYGEGDQVDVLVDGGQIADIGAGLAESGGLDKASDVIDASGHTRSELNFDPGPGTSSTESSFAAELTSAAEQAWKQS